MGCGQSKIGRFYSRNKKNKAFGSRRNGVNTPGSASIEQKNGNNNKGSKTNNNGPEVNRNEEQNGSPEKAKKKSIVPPGGQLLQQTEISTSQLDFFRMLDEKIESGPDYDESTDGSHRAEHVKGLLRRWELASVSHLTDVNLNNPSSKSSKDHYHQHLPNRGLIGYHQQQQQQQQPKPQSQLQHQLSSKDREGMRNIVGGRPEQSSPIYVQRVSTNRLDGLLQDTPPAPSMPRHVLESISQSPTQSMKNPPGLGPTARTPGYYQPDIQRVKLPGKPIYMGSSLNGEYSSSTPPQQSIFREKDTTTNYGRQPQVQQLPYDSLVRNSPSNPYVQQFQISTSAPSSTAPRKQQQQRPGTYQLT